MSHDFRLPRDADFKLPCQWKNVAGTVVDITGRTLVANVKSYAARSAVNLSPTVTVTSAANGQFTVDFTDAQTSALLKGKYFWEVLATTGSITQRILSGQITVRDTGDEVAPTPTTQVALQDVLT